MGTELNLDRDSNSDPESDQEIITDSDPNLPIISDPAGSECTTLGVAEFLNPKTEPQKVKKLCGHAADQL